MGRHFDPFKIVGQVIQKFNFNPYIISRMDVHFFQDDYWCSGANIVRLTFETEIEMSDDWIEHMKRRIQYNLKEAFLCAYDREREEQSNYKK